MSAPQPTPLLSMRAPRPRVLLIDHDPEVATALANRLAADGYRTTVATTAPEARALLPDFRPDLILLEVMLPDTDGLLLCADIRATHDLPILVCTATRRRRDGVLALRLGADDFLTKPVDVEELEARIDAVMRRAKPEAAPSPEVETDRYCVGDLVVDRRHRYATLGGTAIHLTPTEYRLLCALLRQPDSVVTREALARLAWGWGDANRGRTVDTHIRRLRVKLQSAGTPPPAIISVRGMGYKISSHETDRSSLTSVA